ncbi:cell division protein FtsQ [Gluconacetobacter sacchari DSM 12717]|uniref:Cell division protein FtsQ n=2 Tax=Gluconacetobacter sacchari TaxID=92759 RepID=A0A7W4NQM7_9PROT|nr:cell division protein FtsQ/DivIB [Gluconacetobacter sacchari]MBB2160183.1 FtsQ-type POTRA domain-containing protein [Gluconacetobacter sacchari]GBQ26836.1 cell division protein FtsQ [Gluconacetobacter sacchari DSM 12717]
MRRTGDHRDDRPSRLSIFLRRQRRTARPLALAVVLLAIGAGAVMVVHDMKSEERFAPIRARLVSMLPLRVTDIQVSGRALTSEAALRDALGVRIGDPVLGFSVEGARQRIDALPFVDHSVVERHLPGTIVVRLTERSPFAVWQNQGRFMLIDRAGNQVRDQGMTGKDAQAFMQLPLVVGLGANIAAAPLIDALAGQPVVRDHVAAAVRVGLRRWNLVLRDGTTVLLPEGEDLPALKRLADLQAAMKLLDRPVVAIDLRLPDRMVVEQPPSAEPAAQPSAAPTPAAPGGSKPAGPAHDATPGSTPAARDRVPAHATAATPHRAPPVPAPASVPTSAPAPAFPSSPPGHAAPRATLPPPVPNLPPNGEPEVRRRA